MNVQMTKLSEEVRELNAENIVQFLSFSIDPEKDTPEALKNIKISTAAIVQIGIFNG